MNPLPPAVSIAPLRAEDGAALARFIGPRLAAAPFSVPLDEDAVRREILAEPPPAVFPVRWQRHLHLGAWRAGRLTGFLDAAVGFDTESLDLPDYQPLGLIRCLALPQEPALAAAVAAALLDAVQAFWQQTGVGYVKAYHLSTGYPSFQAGAGILPGDWGDQVRALTGAGFRLAERYYCLYRTLAELQEEVIPQADMNLVFRGGNDDRRYEVYYRRIDWVGRARLVRSLILTGDGELERIAYLPDIHISPQWRRQDIGKWLLRRLINDATLEGYRQMVVHIAHHAYAAMNLFVQQGFQELSYRGYTLDKVLTD